MVSAQVSNLAIMLVMMQAGKKIPFDDPNVLNIVRIVYVVSNVLIAGLYLYIRQQVMKKNDLTMLKYVEPTTLASPDKKVIEISIRDYDLQQVKSQLRFQVIGVAILAGMHFYFKANNPLLAQSIIPIKTALEHNLSKVHLFGRPASGDLKRPWAAKDPFSAGGSPDTSKKAIKQALTSGGAKEE